MLTDAEIARFVAWLEAGADSDDAEAERWRSLKEPHTAWSFTVKALAMRTVAARLLEEHKNRKP